MTEIALRQIRAIIAVREEGSFTRAALRENATQSGISQHVATAERALGIRPGNILSLEDATLSDLKVLFGDQGVPTGRLHDLVKPGITEVFVFYSGHGAPDPVENSSADHTSELLFNSLPRLLSERSHRCCP